MKQAFTFLLLMLILMIMATQSVQAVSNAAVLYLRVAAGARPAGMGEAFVSIADDATATYWNPAGLGNAPLSGMLRTERIPDKYGEISSFITLQGRKGPETWVLADKQLLRYEGTNWLNGEEYSTSSDQTLADFMKTIINVEDEEQLNQMALSVIEANCEVSAEDIQLFIETIREVVSEEYDGRDELLTGLSQIEEGYRECRLDEDNFRTLRKRLNEGMKDSVISSEDLDKITYSLDRAVKRFLPSKLIVPYSTGINGEISCLGGTEKYLWVGTDNGLYRRSGKVWARFTDADALPSNNVLCMASAEDYLLIGTEKGPVQYYHGGFKGFGNIPPAPVEYIAYTSASNGYALLGGVIYRYDGHSFSDSYHYTVRIDDNLDKLVNRAGIYFAEDEKQYLSSRIRQLNKTKEPSLEPPAVLSESPDKEMLEEDKETDAESELAADSALAAMTDQLEEDAAIGDIPVSEETASLETMPSLPVEDWLTEGNEIKLPFSPRFRYNVTSLAVDIHNILWVGTTGGLLSFDGSIWTRYGYEKFIVPQGDSAEEALAWPKEKIARYFLPGGDSAKIELLANNIDEYNNLNGAAVVPGDSVYVYSSNIGANVISIGDLHGDLYVGTEYGLMKKEDNGWEEVEFEKLDKRQVSNVVGYESRGYYVSARDITTEIGGKRELTLMHVKWLPNLNLDMYYEFASYVQHLRGIGTIGASIIYLNYGTIQFTDENGIPIGEGHPYEVAASLSYGTSLSSNIKWGITGKFIHSHLSEQGTAKELGEGVASAFAVDMGILYKMSSRLTFGAAVTNLGPDISYIDAAQKDPLPRNLGIGFSYRLINSEYNSLVMQIETNKLLVDMNRGFSRELETAIRHIGGEYVYSNLISLRAGYKYDKEGKVKHLTFGAGLNMSIATFDFAYVPSNEDSPLANTIRISASFNF